MLNRLCVLLVPCAALAQGIQPAVLSGVIQNSVTGRPIVRAGIVARSADRRSASAPASTDGRFSLELPPGDYRLQASAPGFEPQILPLLALAPNERRAPLAIRLVPLSRISGVVTASDGRPVANAVVELLKPVYNSRGMREYQPLLATETGSAGDYRLRDIPAGNYFLRASAPVRRDGLAHLARFYPNASSPAEAPAVALTAAESRLDFQLPLVPAVKLRLHIAGETSEWSLLQAVPAATPFARPEPLLLSRLDTGEYATTLSPGTWRITARYRQQGREHRAIQTVTLHGDSQELTFAPTSGIDLEGALTPSDLSARITLTAVDAIVYAGEPLAVLPGKDGRFHFSSIPPGDWQIGIAPLSPDAYIASLQLDGRDLPGGILSVTPATRGSLRITVSLQGARLRGTVPSKDRGAVLLRSATCRIAPVEPDGAFQFSAVPPGDYRAYWLPQSAADACFDPDAYRQSPLEPASVHLSAGASAEITLAGVR